MVQRTQWKQGQYRVVNTAKYRGRLPVRFLSSWEYKLMVYLDHNQKIQSWGSESVQIPYVSPIDKKVHQYLVDFHFCFVDTSGRTRKFLVEVKPYCQTIAPIKGRKKETTFMAECMTYCINLSKWASAKKYAEKMGFEFIVMTEKDLNIK